MATRGEAHSLNDGSAKEFHAEAEAPPVSMRFADPVRSQVLAGRVLDRELDPELQCIAEAAASALGFPMAAMEIAVRYSLMFRAQVGLPAELATCRGIDRAASPARLVLDSGSSVCIGDVEADPAAPKELFHKYGMRAYVGVPIQMRGCVVGTLCAFDTNARVLSAEHAAKLEKLAPLAARRLSELSGESQAPGHLISHAAEPAFAEIRNLLGSIVANVAYGRMVMSELDPMMELLSGMVSGTLGDAQKSRMKEQLPLSLESQQELAFALQELEFVARKLIDTVGSLEKTVATRAAQAPGLSEAVQAGTLAAHHFTKLVGGVRWAPFPPGSDERTAPSWTGLVISISLQKLSARLSSLGSAGIDACIDSSGTPIAIELKASALGASDCSDLAGELGALLSSVPSIKVSAQGSSIVLRF